nr:immunoglobulin heavy chain junction region [Macaca mulatta]MOY22505.1 immunoglobulin heavy chain junction region [Macaca mulatta]MOY23213.1 immunoglobulin heavy chain junction region [Macaca mulatta]MOY23388.1 immunoglobulin heavy chain junction region [Macaca mulatta]MOY25886.1 immunoglobulin heavy chain junction region [Macaca mulatta]
CARSGGIIVFGVATPKSLDVW